MKEFYLKKTENNEVIFFFRNINKNSVPKKIWIEEMNKKILFYNSKTTFERLLNFLEVRNKIEHKLDDVEISIWIGKEYKIVKIKMSNQINKFENLEFSTSNYINTGEEIYIIKKNNNINERLK
ncbi:hypothetical protein [Streptobacillus moniliformis]|uniref:Uncharacterized protein n=2 Tax=Streptobacillus moniliformis TaxID=34105 RepID=D1AV92_STRM9|nr:hypothetical protein [Streptobacillus moniliformis]ACZ01652.1 hypothetical protein Smon_1197 [Streptobacillus moniliformis DSM 12112]AVL43348.1 hypothetical protein CEP89_05815 [Streptobacillus moniliformis]QXW66326.1 hypothetical protein KX935_03720 [Streptobacillus moniliformis]SQA13170.1 Uncharacterised protein [Streptobacillus moniliformis]